MKTLIKKMIHLFFTGLVILIFNSCEESIDVELNSVESPEISWNKLLDQVDLESEIAFVQNGESIQEAIDAALPGDVIYIEPGTYQKSFNNNKSDVKLIGLSLAPNDLEIKNNKENNIEILKLYDQKSIDHFKRNSHKRGKRGRISDFSRTELGAGIAHYKFKIRVGKGDFDIIRIHRVVRESRKYHPIPTKGNVFMVHGAFTGFEGTFLASGLESENDINAKTSAPFYLASKNIDVWGIDMGWTMVSNDENQDFSFMDEWGYEKDAKHTLKAMRIARMVRGFSGQGFSPLNILGFSSGNTVAYAAANKETQKINMMKRHIKGIISVDNAFKTEDVDSGCEFAQDVIDQINNGIYQNTNGQFFSTVGFLAHEFPSDLSPIFDDGSTTNSQAFRLIFAIDAFGFGFKFVGGDFNSLFNSNEERATRAVANYSHFMPNQLWLEIDAVNCSSMNVTFDDHIGEISVPILYIGAEIGAGVTGEYTSSLTSSTDITNHIVTGFGHVDTWLADDADQLVWSELRSWIGNHR